VKYPTRQSVFWLVLSAAAVAALLLFNDNDWALILEFFIVMALAQVALWRYSRNASRRKKPRRG
jgi:membrane protein implicated in regulation of membrane protease activity